MAPVKLNLIYTSLILLSLFSQYGCKKECVKNINCDLEPDIGGCLSLNTKYYFDKNEGKCKEFNWGGCNGTVPFNTLEECKDCECKD